MDILPGISFLWPDQSSLLASVPSQTSNPKTSILLRGRCLFLHDKTVFPSLSFCIFQLIPVGMCETAERGGVIVDQSIDYPSCRGQTFSHNSVVLMTVCRGGWERQKWQLPFRVMNSYFHTLSIRDHSKCILAAFNNDISQNTLEENLIYCVFILPRAIH